MNIDVFILIGGRSMRFGSDKAFVEIDGELLASRIARIVEQRLAPRNVAFVAASEDQFAPEVLHKLGGLVIFDIKSGSGAWSGLHAALVTAQTEWIFVSACDHPFVSPEFLDLLASGIAEDTDAVVPRQSDGRLQSLCAFYRVGSSLVVVDKILSRGGHLPPLTAIFEQLKTNIIEPDQYKKLKNADKLFLNLNTPADLSNFNQ